MENIALGFVTFVLFKSFLGVYFWYALQLTYSSLQN
jgi:hypothetical protein